MKESHDPISNVPMTDTQTTPLDTFTTPSTGTAHIQAQMNTQAHHGERPTDPVESVLGLSSANVSLHDTMLPAAALQHVSQDNSTTATAPANLRLQDAT